MTVYPEERFHQRQQFDSAHRKPRYSKEEFAQRGDALYDSQIRLLTSCTSDARSSGFPRV